MKTSVHKIGYLSGLIAFGSTTAYVIVQLMQVIGVLHFPLDEILIYGTSLCIVLPFLFEMLALFYVTKEEKKIWSHAALVLTIMYAVFVTANYIVQLATVVPMKIKGNAEEIRLLEQTPHSMFWDFDALGYIFMGLAMLAAIPVFERQGFQKWVRISFIANVLVTPLITFVYFHQPFSEKLLFLGFPWGITAPWAMLMLALMFKKNNSILIHRSGAHS
jgi:hypothetical protein